MNAAYNVVHDCSESVVRCELEWAFKPDFVHVRFSTNFSHTWNFLSKLHLLEYLAVLILLCLFHIISCWESKLNHKCYCKRLIWKTIRLPPACMNSLADEAVLIFMLNLSSLAKINAQPSVAKCIVLLKLPAQWTQACWFW